MCLSKPISEFIFLGSPIGECHYAEGAGGSDLYLFSGGKFQLSHWGIGGINFRIYGDYFSEDVNVLLNTTEEIGEIGGNIINVRGKELKIKRLGDNY